MNADADYPIQYAPRYLPPSHPWDDRLDLDLDDDRDVLDHYRRIANQETAETRH